MFQRQINVVVVESSWENSTTGAIGAETKILDVDNALKLQIRKATTSFSRTLF